VISEKCTQSATGVAFEYSVGFLLGGRGRGRGVHLQALLDAGRVVAASPSSPKFGDGARAARNRSQSSFALAASHLGPFTSWPTCLVECLCELDLERFANFDPFSYLLLRWYLAPKSDVIPHPMSSEWSPRPWSVSRAILASLAPCLTMGKARPHTMLNTSQTIHMQDTRHFLGSPCCDDYYDIKL
jgi:hypothetical protein